LILNLRTDEQIPMSKILNSKLYAAVLIPRTADGALEEAALVNQLEFLLAAGMRNFVFNGATGEYCLASPADLKRCLQLARSVFPAAATYLCGAGWASLRGTLELGRLSIDAGAEALLVPMPYFFPYAQADLMEFAEQAASQLQVPILLYNLPQFTSGLEPTTVARLLLQVPNIIGIKDSSGSLEIFRALTREGIDALRISGSDSALPDALVEGICDGAISGVACVVPELLLKLIASSPQSAAFSAARQKLRELVAKLDALPCPWGLKALAEARGIAKATYHQPLSASRVRQIAELQAWFRDWIGDLKEVCSS
jgi:4-hydroxy-tetrahydrodipicolinate synthase